MALLNHRFIPGECGNCNLIGFNTIVITMYGVRWALEIFEGILCKVYDYPTGILYP